MDFTFKGLTATSFGIIVNSMPTFKKPKRRVNKRTVDGRHGSIVDELGYDSYSLPSKITPTDAAYFDSIYSWLDGPGVLICSDDPLKYRNAEVIEEVDYGRLAIWKEATVEFFIANPFRYILNEVDQTIATFPATISNIGTVESLPLLKLVGSGNVSVTLNGTTFTYTFINGETYVYIDCREQIAYYDSSVNYRDGSMSGNYPTLKIGNNTITKTGTLTQVIVSKRTCYL